MNKKHRSYFAQYCCRSLPLSIETGRWRNINLEDRICKMCDSFVEKDEYHIMFHCSLEKKFTDPFLHHVCNTVLNIDQLNEVDKITNVYVKNICKLFCQNNIEIIEVRHDKLFVKT